MPAPFRIYRPAAVGVEATARKKIHAKDTAGQYMDRLIRLIPSEVVAVYLAGKGYAEHWPSGIWPVICLILVFVIRIWGTRDPSAGVQWVAVGVSAVSFVIWVYAIGGQFFSLRLPDAGIASAAVLVWTVVVPLIYKGD